MILIPASIIVYMLFIAIILSCCFGNMTDNVQHVDDSSMWITIAGATLVEVFHNMMNTSTNDRRFAARKRRCVSGVFSELGTYLTRRCYRMIEDEFWKLYNLIAPTYPKENTRNRRKCILFVGRCVLFIFL